MEERCPKGTRDNRASQLNPSRPAYYQLRGSSPKGAERSADRPAGLEVRSVMAHVRCLRIATSRTG